MPNYNKLLILWFGGEGGGRTVIANSDHLLDFTEPFARWFICIPKNKATLFTKDSVLLHLLSVNTQLGLRVWYNPKRWLWKDCKFCDELSSVIYCSKCSSYNNSRMPSKQHESYNVHENPALKVFKVGNCWTLAGYQLKLFVHRPGLSMLPLWIFEGRILNLVLNLGLQMFQISLTMA